MIITLPVRIKQIVDKFFSNSKELKKAYIEGAKKNEEIEEKVQSEPYFGGKNNMWADYIEGKTSLDQYYNQMDSLTNLLRQYDSIPDNSTLKNLYLKTLDKDVGNYLSYMGMDPNTSFISLLYRFARRHIPKLLDEVPLTMNTRNASGTDIIDLSSNTLRITDPEHRYKNILFNEFVENWYPSVRKASEYKSGKDFKVGDLFLIPRSDLTYFAGIEDGKFKIGPIDIFLDNTVVYPARNIKKDLKPITKINIEGTSSNKLRSLSDKGLLYPTMPTMKSLWEKEVSKTIPPEFLEELEGIRLRVDDWEYKLNTNAKLISSLYGIPVLETEKLINMGKSNTIDYSEIDRIANKYTVNPIQVLEIALNVSDDRQPTDIPTILDLKYSSDHFGGSKELSEYIYNLRDKLAKYKTITSDYTSYLDRKNRNLEPSYTYTDINGETHPISKWNASILDNKMVIGNPEGSLFIGRFLDINQELLDSLNARLAKSPGYLIRPDLGSFDTYRTDSTDLTNYLKQYFEHPDPNDPNLYVVGNNNLLLWKKQGGKLNYLNYFK